MLRVFPITLTRAAKMWVDRLSLGTINTWDLLKKAFIQRYCPPSKTTKQLEEIHNFKQEDNGMLYQAWERRLNSDSSDGITAITSKLDSLGRDMKKLKENVHVIQVGGKNCGGDHLNKDRPLHEEVRSVEEIKYGEFGRPFPINNENSARYSIGPLRYYTCMDNRPPFDVGDSVNILPGSMFDHLKLTNLKETNMLVEMADMTKKALVGIVENVSVKIDKILFPFDFIIIDMLGDPNETMILGKKGYVLDDIWEKCEQVHGETTYPWHDEGFKEEERWESGLDEKYYDPSQVCVETFEDSKRIKVQRNDPKGNGHSRKCPKGGVDLV
nr:hypothetical protein [Tanacetum cinerariifolium]